MCAVLCVLCVLCVCFARACCALCVLCARCVCVCVVCVCAWQNNQHLKNNEINCQDKQIVAIKLKKGFLSCRRLARLLAGL